MELREARRMIAEQALERLQHLQDDSGGNTEAEDEMSDEEVIIGS